MKAHNPRYLKASHPWEVKEYAHIIAEMTEQIIRPERFCQLRSPIEVVMKAIPRTGCHHGKYAIHQPRIVSGNPSSECSLLYVWCFALCLCRFSVRG